MYSIIIGLVERGKKNSRWLTFQDGTYYTVLIPNIRDPFVGQVIFEKSLTEATIKQKKKELVIVKIISLKEEGSKRMSRWNVSLHRIHKTCLISNKLILKKGDFIPVHIGDLSDL